MTSDRGDNAAPRIIGLWSPAPQCGKSTVAHVLKRRLGYQVEPFAATLKAMVVRMLECAGYDIVTALKLVHEEKEAPIQALPGAPSARHLLRTLGTEWGRDCVSAELWPVLWQQRCRRHALVVADDVRFANEARAVRELGGEVWAVTRPGYADASGHRSEGGLGAETPSRVFVNDGSREALEWQVLVAMGVER